MCFAILRGLHAISGADVTECNKMRHIKTCERIPYLLPTRDYQPNSVCNAHRL
jgi:hypothetical protein